MKLRVRYDDGFQTLELDTEAMDGLWVSLSLKSDEDLSQEEKEELLQAEFDRQFNRPEYNNFHKFYRHRGYSKARPGKDDDPDDYDPGEPLLSEVADDSIFRRDEIEREKKDNYDAVCQWVRTSLADKPDVAEAIIAIKLNGETIRGYARRYGVHEDSIRKKMKRAIKKLKKLHEERPI